MSEELRRYCEERLEAMRSARSGWLAHYRDLSAYFLPRRVRWLMTPNELRGKELGSKLIDTTSIIAARSCAAGMMGGIASPARPWFKLVVENMPPDYGGAVSIWLAECEDRMYKVFGESNFYNSIAQALWDLVIFGTGPMMIEEDYEDVIRCFNPAPGEYFLEKDENERVNTIYREITMSASSIKSRFGEARMSDGLRGMLGQGGNKSKEAIVCHAVEPNDGKYGLSKTFEYRSFFWERSSATNEFLALEGYRELPGMFPRWDLDSADVYGRSPAMEALPDVKQLQQETKRKAQALDKMVNPPLLADVTLKNQPTSSLPGGITYVPNLGSERAGMRSVYNMQFPVQEVKEDIKEIQDRIRSILFNDLFLMFAQLQAEPRSAAAIDARREEKLVMLGPVLERFENEGLDPVVNRVFNIMARARLLPPPPPELQGEYVKVQYISMLAEAQKAASTSSIERMLGTLGNLMGVDPTVADNLDMDETVDEYATRLGLPPKLIRGPKKVSAIRAARADAQQKQQALEQTPAAVQGAGVLSKTPVGGGQNALQKMLGLDNG